MAMLALSGSTTPDVEEPISLVGGERFDGLDLPDEAGVNPSRVLFVAGRKLKDLADS